MTTRRSGGPEPRPNRLAVLIVEAVARALPAGDIRSRYQQELVAELLSMPRRRQLRYAIGTLITIRALRNAVTGRHQVVGVALVVKRRRPVWCAFTGHKWQKKFTDDNQRYASCRKCGKVLTGGVWVIDPAVQGGLGVR